MKLISTFRYIALTLGMLLAASISKAQPTPYFKFEATGIPGSQIKTISAGKFVKILTTGGFVNIEMQDAFKKSKGLHLQAYYKDKKVKSDLAGSIYLYQGNEYIIDVLAVATNNLVTRYTVQRPILIPKISADLLNGKHLYTTKNNGREGEISLAPNEKIKLKIAPLPNFDGMEVEYTLRNLKTKRTHRGSSKSAIKELLFEANTDYEFRFNYSVQKESVGIIYIHVKPHWYQSPITYLVLLITLVAVGVLLLTLAFKKRIRSSQKEQQKLEQAAIRLQSLLNPHFTFNALSTVQGLMNTDRIAEANQYLQEFSSLLRQSLTKSKHVYTTLDQELEMMRLYIKLEAFRFNFAWEIEVADELNTSLIEVPTLLLQPLIENAIKHGLSKLGNQGLLQIICQRGQKKDTFVIKVKDNGSWLPKTEVGYGLSLTAERIETINKMRKDRQVVLGFDRENGTTAILTFHNWIDT